MANQSNKTLSGHLACVIFACLFILTTQASAKPMEFMVRPMKVELAVRAGRTADETIEIRSLDNKRFMTLDLKLVELGQTEDAYWAVIDTGRNTEPNAEPNTITSNPRSCREWIKLSADSVRIDPLGVKTVKLKIAPRAGVGGFYYAGLCVQTRPALNITQGIPVIARILIPVLFEMQGRTVRQKINLTDIGMESRPQIEEKPATSILLVGIANEGSTYSRLKSSAKVQSFLNGHWRDITEVEHEEVGILPGVSLKLKDDVGKSLPPGKYKLKGNLYVDGRRIKPIEKEIDFAGDPNAKAVTANAALKLEPESVSVTIVPGATRSAVLNVQNPSDSAITVRAGAVIPPKLKGIAYGELKGEDLACADWVQMMPDNFTLPAGKQQKIRINVKAPQANELHASYYAVLYLQGRYPDGQSAGTTTAMLNVQNKRVKLEPAIQPIKLSIAHEEASRYAITTRFGNTGNVHITPRCSATLMTADGRIARTTALAGETDLMLPLEVRNFSGLIDLAAVPPGAYRLEAMLEYTTDEGTNKQTTQAITIQVSNENGVKIVEIIGPKEEAAK
jgi:hypothetical protein